MGSFKINGAILLLFVLSLFGRWLSPVLPIDSRAGSMKPGFSLNTLGCTKKVDLGVEGSLAGELCLNSHPQLIQGIVLALLCSYCSSWGDNNSPSWEQPRSQGTQHIWIPPFARAVPHQGALSPFKSWIFP